MSTPALPSYSSGTSTVPLLGDTIGTDLDRTAARVGDHEALVECASGRRWTYPELVAEVDACALGLDTLGVAKGDRVGIWAPNCAEWVFVQYGTAKLGWILVNITPASRTHELSYVLRQAGISVLLAAPSFRTSDYRAMVEEVRGDCPDLRTVGFPAGPAPRGLPRRPRVGAADGRRAGGRPRPARRAGRPAEPRRPDQHPVHVRDDRLPQGRLAHPPQPAEQRLLRRRGLRVHRGRPGLHPGALLPLLRHGHGQPRLHLARRHDGDTGPRLRPRADPAGGAGGAVHLAVRRPDDVHRGA